MKLMMLAALAVATPVAGFAQMAPAPDAQTAPAAPADPAAQAPTADQTAAAPAAPAAAAPTGQVQMGAPVANPAPAAPESYPVCSATVKDQCREGAGGGHKMAHRKHKK
ncbi:hypothetical protein PX554_11720 [Sphingomonas sp. H39-1-10]|uniref:hypothetical protein n=1 Tax=Sphingomonas TaxID=13687 RepID=UPI00087E4356|nr:MULTISPECIES: hypothetical protein [Sphingomonas]MDF0488800.1 hypothetical protein [Sphingomonas pollutisoli]SDA13698.1 hypothetical protein SAMN03159340_00443 [Sphingomonas sp. NFR15]